MLWIIPKGNFSDIFKVKRLYNYKLKNPKKIFLRWLLDKRVVEKILCFQFKTKNLILLTILLYQYNKYPTISKVFFYYKEINYLSNNKSKNS